MRFRLMRLSISGFGSVNFQALGQEAGLAPIRLAMLRLKLGLV